MACEAAAADALARGCHVVVDRCNFDPQQRAVWLGLARTVGGPRARVLALHLNIPPSECKRRCMLRQGHPTLGARDADAVIDRRVGIQLFWPPRNPPAE